jgi:hypothetical protein
VLTEHLTTPDYQLLTPTTANDRIQQVKHVLMEALQTNKHLLSQPEIAYFNRSLKLKNRIPIFYGMPKVHKIPLKLHPVVSCVNSFNSIFSNWLDFKMKELLHTTPSYLKIQKS